MQDLPDAPATPPPVTALGALATQLRPLLQQDAVALALVTAHDLQLVWANAAFASTFGPTLAPGQALGARLVAERLRPDGEAEVHLAPSPQHEESAPATTLGACAKHTATPKVRFAFAKRAVSDAAGKPVGYLLRQLDAGAATDLRAQTFAREHRLFRRFAHDVRNAIGAAKLGLDGMLRGAGLSERVARKAERATLALAHADGLITKFAELRHLVADAPLPLQRAQSSLAQVVQDAVAALPATLRQRLRLALPVAGEGAFGTALLARAVRALIDNAVRHGHGDAPIDVAIAVANGRVRLTVANEGPPPTAWPIDLARPLASVLGQAPEATDAAGPIGWRHGIAFVQAVARGHGATVTFAQDGPRAVATFAFGLPGAAEA